MKGGSFDVLIVGIGGQGTILSSNILGEACIAEGKTVRGAESHGMAQRGGSVESHVRIGGLFGPLIAPGTADLLISFDLLEALRYRHYLRKAGKLVVNSRFVVPTSVYLQGLPVPEATGILSRLKPCNPCVIDAEEIALEAGSSLVQNVVILGAASHFLPLSENSLMAAVERLVPPKTVELNRRAFEMGRRAGAQCKGGDTSE
ncbi:MAG: indolepyruvate oxidoreductase subunit beta [Methanoregulaceae archaeon]|nr:indolepyruvate oxidoreductase subunit beta [Methanoregulaceae archaeon]